MKRHRQQGFTLVEVLIAMLIAMVGLLGTVAVQRIVLNATLASADAATAMRLCTQMIEEFASRQTSAGTVPTGPPAVDQLALAPATTTNTWQEDTYVNDRGQPNNPVTTQDAEHRFLRHWMVVNPGVGLPYRISVEVRYPAGDRTKSIRIDVERPKTW